MENYTIHRASYTKIANKEKKRQRIYIEMNRNNEFCMKTFAKATASY